MSEENQAVENRLIDISTYPQHIQDSITASINKIVNEYNAYEFHRIDDIVAAVTDVTFQKIAKVLLTNAVNLSLIETTVFHPHIITKMIPWMINHSITLGLCGVNPIVRSVDHAYKLRNIYDDDNKMSLNITQDVCHAKTHKLITLPLVEVQNNIEFDEYLAKRVVPCIDSHTLREVLSIATPIGTPTVGELDIKSLYFKINIAANDIAKHTRRAAGNVIVVSHAVLDKLCVDGYVDLTLYGIHVIEQYNLKEPVLEHGFVGWTAIDARKVYVYDWSQIESEDIVLVGYQGSAVDTGITYSTPDIINANTHGDNDAVTFTSRSTLSIDEQSPLYYRKVLL